MNTTLGVKVGEKRLGKGVRTVECWYGEFDGFRLRMFISRFISMSILSVLTILTLLLSRSLFDQLKVYSNVQSTTLWILSYEAGDSHCPRLFPLLVRDNLDLTVSINELWFSSTFLKLAKYIRLLSNDLFFLGIVRQRFSL